MVSLKRIKRVRGFKIPWLKCPNNQDKWPVKRRQNELAEESGMNVCLSQITARECGIEKQVCSVSISIVYFG